MSCNVAQVVQRITSYGIELGIIEDRLAFRPSGKATPEIRDLIQTHKADLLDYVKRQSRPQPETTEETFSNPLDLQDVLGFPTRLLSSLPLPPTLILSVTGITEPVAFDFRPRPNTWRRQPEPRRPTFDLAEIGALLEAAEQGRCRPRDFAAWCQRKQRDHSWCLTREVALQGANGLIAKPPKPKGWTLERLLSAIGATLRLIKLDSGGAQAGKRGPYSGGAQ